MTIENYTAYFGLAVAAVAVAGLAGAVLRRRRALPDGSVVVGNAEPPDTDALRRMSHAAARLRNIGMLMHGYAGTGPNRAAPGIGLISQAAQEAFELADDLYDYAMQIPRSHVIRDEVVYLPAVVEEAIGDLVGIIIPGTREFRSFPDHAVSSIRADRRALRFILRDALGVAIRGTGEGDPITIRQMRDAESFIIQIDYTENATLPPQASGRPAVDDVPPRMALARSLIAAQGGRMDIAAAYDGKASIALHFPLARVVDARPPEDVAAAAKLADAA